MIEFDGILCGPHIDAMKPFALLGCVIESEVYICSCPHCTAKIDGEVIF